jgi:hypothetical protein
MYINVVLIARTQNCDQLLFLELYGSMSVGKVQNDSTSKQQYCAFL